MYLNRQRTSLLFTVQLPVKAEIARSVWFVEYVEFCVCLSYCPDVLPTLLTNVVLVEIFVLRRQSFSYDVIMYAGPSAQLH